jgi:hypothetical protein
MTMNLSNRHAKAFWIVGVYTDRGIDYLEKPRLVRHRPNRKDIVYRNRGGVDVTNCSRCFPKTDIVENFRTS